MNWLLLISLVTAAPPPASTVQGFIGSEDLAVLCQARDEASALCLGYLVGAVDQLLARQSRRPSARHTICLPEALSADALQVAIVARLSRDPGHRPPSAAEAIRQAVEAEYACPLGGRPVP